ncbi:hypothetical protein CEUSTIGMA_g4687.t1 [Chlamydomonas eustigma]|uniref:Uncharacterized protein n=1 Tax=Chlamydomonas eustigma TaxID=1157962 RepID=A0A250X391_9CHLO|nr:hypothetical protein CEUSTIGMA_g4687.t1 [Chlamydomonas eustigma]|eukprot:GAX77240.1 hypothetical protein CEUSTIGMA_g4687.t1 [Chlamydomonas eustigma]
MLESYLPQDFYLNRWTNLQPKAEGQFHASPEEIKRAALTRDKRYLRKEITKQKYVLFRAILENDVDACKKLLRTPLLLERHTSEGTTPLGLAAATGNAAIVSFLLDLGADVNARDRTGATPLHLAALLGHTDIIKMLLESKQGGTTGRDYLLRQGSHSGETPVMAAAKGGSVDALKELAKAGGETGTTCSVSGCSGVDCLMLASRHDRVETMKWLLERGLQPTRRDDIGRDALMHACCTGSLQAAELLLKSQPLGADLSARDSKGYSALHHACLGGNLRLVELLNDKLSGSNSINFTAGPEGGQLLCLACDAGQAGVAEWLLSNKAGKLEIVSEGPQNPLHAAVHAGRTEIIEVLLASGARIDVRDARGRTPLAWAATHGKDDMVRLLVSKGASMLSVDLHGRVPRQLAYLHRHWDLANMLSEMAKSSSWEARRKTSASASYALRQAWESWVKNSKGMGETCRCQGGCPCRNSLAAWVDASSTQALGCIWQAAARELWKEWIPECSCRANLATRTSWARIIMFYR